MPRDDRRTLVPLLALVALVGVAPAFAADDDDNLQGSVELAYRSINVDGSERKFDEDFDGLGSGYFLSQLTLNWLDDTSKLADYARVDLIGLGGEPYEQSLLRIGRQNKYELRFTERKQDYIYNLFELIDDEDGHRWDTERQTTHVGLSLHPTDTLEVVIDFQDLQRRGDSLFMKDVSRDVFLLETPIDYRQKRYTVGFDLELGDVDLVFRQTRQRYANLFENTTEGDLGLGLPEDGDQTELSFYDWRQRESGSADLTTFKLHTPLGQRLELTVGLYGTLFGEEELTSNVGVDATGIAFNGNPLLIDGGFSNTELEVDHLLLDADLSIFVADPVSVHLQYRSLDRDLVGSGLADLDGRACAATGTPCSSDAECDAVIAGDTCEINPITVDTTFDYGIDTTTALVEVRPTKGLTLLGGYRTIDRSVERNGYDAIRNEDFESDGDSTLLFGLTWRANQYLRLSADYEDGELDRAFVAPAALESERTRLRATITPQSDMQIGLSYLDYEHTNSADPRGMWYGTCAASGAVCTTDSQCDSLTPGDTCTIAPFESATEGSNWAAWFTHRPSERVNYLLRYAEQDVESSTAVLFDGPGFGGPAAFALGDTQFDNTNTQWTAQVNFSWATPWSAYVRMWMAESDGNNRLLNDSPSGFSNDEVIDQEFLDAEAGLSYRFPSGLYLGGAVRHFDYDDRNDRLDYDGDAVILRGGFRF